MWGLLPIQNPFFGPFPLLRKSIPMLHKNLNNVLESERWGGRLCGYFGIAISILTLITEVKTGSLYFKMRKKT